MATEAPLSAASETDSPPLSAPIYKIANAALWCIAGALFEDIFLSGLAREAMRHGMRGVFVALTAAAALLLLSSIVLGTIALCGISRYGRKKLLWKGLVGILVPILFILLAFAGFLKAKRLSEERARQHQQSP
jgi:MFS family permease